MFRFTFPILKSKNLSAISALLIMAIYIAITLYIAIHLLHDTYNTYAFDLGLFTQSLKYTLQGSLLWQTPTGGSELAHHFSPILLLLVPLYKGFPYPQMLLVVQTLILGLSGYLVYLLAKDFNYSNRTALIIEILFFVNPLVWGVALFDFHPVAFAIPGILLMFLGMRRKRWILFAIGLIIALTSREDAIFVVGVFGVTKFIYDYWKTRKIERITLVIIASSIIVTAAAVATSTAFSNGHSPLILSYFTNRYTYVEQSLWEGIVVAMQTFFSSGSILLFCGYLVPLGCLPLLSLKWAIPGLFVMLSGMFSSYWGQHDALLQYTAPAIPFMFMAFIDALPRFEKDARVQDIVRKTNGRMKFYALSLLLITALSIISVGRLELARLPNAHDEAIEQVLAAIPDDATVTVNNNIFSHICARTDAYLPRLLDKETGIIDGDWGYPDRDTEYVVVDSMHMQLSTGGYWEIAIMRQIDEKYDLILNIDGTRLYRLRETQ